jgi:hypothetical protein
MMCPLFALPLAVILSSSTALADGDPPTDLTIMAAAPIGLSHSHLGRPYSATFEPLIGKDGKTLFPSAKKPNVETINEFPYDVVEIDNSHQLRANARAWGVAGSLSAGGDQRYMAYRAYQLTKVEEIDDTTDPRAAPANAAYYVRRIYYGRLVDVVISGSATNFSAEARADFLVLGGASIEAFARKYNLEMRTVGRGLKAANPTAALFATTASDIQDAYKADPDFNGGNVVPILVEYRRIPKSDLADLEDYEWKPEAQEVSAQRLHLREIQVNSADEDWQPSGFTLSAGDTAIVTASGQIDINGKGKMRAPDAVEHPLDGGNWERPTQGALQLKLGATTIAWTRTETVIDSDKDGQELKFRVYDDAHKYSDNKGTYVVRVLLIPAKAVPANPE